MNTHATMLTTAILATFSLPLANEANATGVYGQVSLNSGFQPDPHSQPLTAGGPNAASSINPDCRGYIATTADYTVYFAAGEMPLYMGVISDTDTTLVVRGPDGRIFCDDDGAEASLNPLLRWGSPQSGRYDIWVGTYAQNDNAPAILYISEIGEYTQ